MHNVSPRLMLVCDAALSRISRVSDLAVPSPALRSSAYVSHRGSQKDADSPNRLGSRSPSHSHSRAASPLRILQQWSSGLHRHHRSAAEEPFVPIDPFKLKAQFNLSCCSCFSDPEARDIEQGVSHDCNDCLPISSLKAFFNNAHVFVSDTLPRQLYLNILLRLPAMYFSRVSRIFEDAEVSRPDIQRMIDANGGGSGFGVPGFNLPPIPEPAGHTHNTTLDSHGHGTNTVHPPSAMSPLAAGLGLTAHVGAAPASISHVPLPCPDDWIPPQVSPALIRFKHSWEAFIDSLLREWKTLNVVSALLLS